jgi:hypothetical protein
VNATAYTVNTSVLRQTTGDNTNGVRGFIDTAAYFAGFTNGTMITSNTTAVTFQPGYNQSFVMGQWNVGWLNGYIYEILIYNRALSLGEYQSVEGYLSQKWGFSPGKAYVPTSIPGCALWLDGADPTGTGVAPANGATVSTWVDKSGNGRNASGGVSPTYNSSQKAITFNGSSWLTTSYSSVPTNETTFIVYQTTSAALANNCFMIGPTNIGGRLILSVNENDGFGLSFKIGSYGVANGSRIIQNQNQIYLGTTTVASTTSFVYLNGTQGPSSTLTYSGSGTTQIGTAVSGTAIYIGFIYEIVIYNTNLTTPQQQQIEGYLASKWGLQGSLALTHPNYLTTGNFVRSLTLATTHPYYSLPPATRVFTPLDVPGCALWLDGADQRSVTFSSGSNVSQWNDKSGNGINATVLNGTPTYTQALGMTFNGSSALQVNYTASPTIETLFIIIKFNSVSAQGDIFSGTAMGQREYLLYSPYSPGTIYLGRYGNAPSGSINGGTVITSSNYMLGYVFNGTANTISLYQGGNLTSSGTPQFTYSSGGTISAIGSYNGGGYLQGQIYELIVYNTALGAAQRQAVEGYLANKWGLKPTLPVFANPTSIPGCAMWLDGSDPAGTGVAPANNSAISTWVDKSGNGCNATASSSNPTFLSNQYNGYGLINFSGGVYFSNATFNYNLPNRTLFIVCSSTVAGYTGFLSFNNTAGTDYSASNTMNYASPGTNSLQIAAALSAAGGGFNVFFGTGSTTQFAIYGDTFSGTTESYFMNGSNMGSTTTSTTFGASTSIYIGARQLGGFTGTYSITGTISELIIYNYAITSSQRQQIEGYLAWKWGLQASLPATHPFAATVPVPHPFNKVPPTIRQPALYYDVAPGNWVRDWQPYLRALTRANAGATASLSLTGVTASSTVASGSGVLAPNGNIYFSVGGGGSVLSYYNPTANTVSTITLPQTIDSPAAVLGADGNVYIYPINANTGQNIIKITTSTNVATTISAGTNGWWGMVLAPNGNLYGIPQRTMTNVLVLNTSTGITSTITGSANGYWGGVLAPNGKIYCIPGGSVGIIDPVAGTITASAVSGSGQGNGYFGGVLGWDGNIYCIPTGTTVGVINPITNTFTTFASNSVFYSGGCLGPDGKIYCIPRGGGAIGVINIATQTFSASSMTLASVGDAYNGATLTPSGTIYVAPYNGGASSHTIYQISFAGLTQTPSLNYCLSAYTNKF